MKLLTAKEKKERGLGVRLGLKAFRSNSPKSAMIRRPYRPGEHGKKRSRNASEFKLQLVEKQKVKLTYGLTESQIKAIFEKALKSREATFDKLVELFESRLDSMVYWMGFAPSRIMARHLVSHGHFLVNGRKVTVPSFKVKPGNSITIKESSKEIPLFKELKNILKKNSNAWISLDAEKLQGTLTSIPHDVELPFNINAVIDYYAR